MIGLRLMVEALYFEGNTAGLTVRGNAPKNSAISSSMGMARGTLLFPLKT